LMTTKEEYYAWCLQKKRNDENMRELEKAKIRDQIRQEWQIRIWDIRNMLPEYVRDDLVVSDFIQEKVENMEFPYRITGSSNIYESSKKEYRDVELPLLVLGKPLVFVRVRGHQAITENDIVYRVSCGETTHVSIETAIAIALEAEGWDGDTKR